MDAKIESVIDQTGCNREEADAALVKCNGNVVEAIMSVFATPVTVTTTATTPATATTTASPPWKEIREICASYERSCKEFMDNAKKAYKDASGDA